ncbi:MerR family transcriptional regulator [Wukongibacter baidiensis]|uniref:MerR family transcriptional regulator n=1 Tax=Wukongibacter baidiensis TaxID=1723361 RepID=UPI003D7FD893
MRIGTFAKKNQLTVDTIRYYMDLGLLVPVKKNAYYDFDDTCQKDLSHVIRLKRMGFKLKDIGRILVMMRIGSASPKSETEYILKQFENRIRDIDVEEESLRKMKQSIIQEMENLRNFKLDSNALIGVRLEHISLFHCNYCEGSFNLEDAIVKQGKILDGSLVCVCGARLIIENGMIIGKHNFGKRYFNVSKDLTNVYEDYVNIADPAFLNQLYSGMNWIKRQVCSKQESPLIILEFGVGSGFFLKYFMKHLKETDIYIAIDHDKKRLELLKDMLVANNMDKQILLICSDFLELPLKSNVAKVVVDFYGSMSYALENEKPLVTSIEKWLSIKGEYFGCFVIYESLYDEVKNLIRCRSVFSAEGILSLLRETQMSLIEDVLGDVIKSSNDYKKFHQTGKNMRNYIIHCKMNKTKEEPLS